MRNIGLTVYGFSIQDRENQRYELHDIEGRTLISIVYDYINRLINTYSADNATETIFSFEQVQIENVMNEQGQERYTILYGRVKTGEYGIESELVDYETGNVAHNRTTNEADVMPFGFAILVPAGEVNSAIIILQSIGNIGMKMVLQKKMTECIKGINNQFKFEMGTIVPRVYLDRFFNHGVLKKIRLISYAIPDDDSDRYGINRGTRETSREIIIKKPVGFLENKRRELTEWRNGARRYDQVIQIDGFEYDDLRLEFATGRTSKTISLRNVDKLIVTEDISDNVDIIGGHPEFTGLCAAMKETGEFYLVARGLLIEEG